MDTEQLKKFLEIQLTMTTTLVSKLSTSSTQQDNILNDKPAVKPIVANVPNFYIFDCKRSHLPITNINLIIMFKYKILNQIKGIVPNYN